MFELSFDFVMEDVTVILLFQHEPTEEFFAAIINLNDVELDEIATERFSEFTDEVTETYDEGSTVDGQIDLQTSI